MNKAEAGYKMLTILSAVDNNIQEVEKEVINNFIKEKWSAQFDSLAIDTEVNKLAPDEWMPSFQECRDAFYNNAMPKERNEFLQFAMDLVKADDVITAEENRFLKNLFDSWDPDNI